MNFLRRTRLLAVTIALCLLTACGSGDAVAIDLQGHEFRVAIADESDTTKQIVEGFQKRFPAAQIISDPSTPGPKKRNAIYVAVGPAALRALVAKETDGVIISVFTSSYAYRSIMENSPRARSNSITAIFAESAPADQLHLISALYKRKVSVAILLTDKTHYVLPSVRHAASSANIDLEVEHVTADDNLNKVLNRTASSSVILAVPDSTIYTTENIRNILVTSYRHNQSVVGFSTALVKAGALASVFSSIDDIIAQVEEVVSEFTMSGRLPDPQFPKYFSVVVNDNVARSLNLVVDDNVRKLSRKPSGRQQ